MKHSIVGWGRQTVALLVLGGTLGVVAGAGWAGAEPLQDETTQEVALSPDERMVAHHEGSSAGVGQLLHNDEDPDAEVTDSLWGNLLLSMAYRRDAELKHLVKKMGVSNNLFLASIAGVSGLGLAQSVTGLATLYRAEGGSHDEHGGSGHRESKGASIMGVVGSGVTLLSIGTHVYLEHRYKKQIKARQQIINHQVLHVLEDLESGVNTELVQPQLVSLVGGRATGEFLQLWRAAHP
ncbi:hypothetical protein [Vampirovibrio chlorellavorus]|uniref:hypothetical protein n=1 Tax=Vampirovibrio chlorellavorus TaxID=758823 RepID=UPI0026F3029C|nr:hypothetical protein [Vampirovibrio chlorellavorus]